MGMKREKFQGAVFDLDGTLLNTLEDLARSMNRVLEGHGLATHPMDDYRYFVGDGARTLVKRAVPEHMRQDEKALALCLKEFLEDYAANWDANTSPYPDIPQMLEGLARMNIKLAVLSNKPHNFTRLCVKRYLGQWKFQAVLGERPGIPRKPSPDGALEAARIMGVKPEQCIYLGDTSIDMKTAKAAGMFPVGVLWGFRDEQELRESGAKLLISRPRELLKFMEEG